MTHSISTHPCATVLCEYPRTCTVQNNKPICVCPEVCTRIYAPVCGSDGNTYGNECKLRQFACRTNQHITTTHQGECTEHQGQPKVIQKTYTKNTHPDSQSTNCASVTCPYGSSCEMRDGKAICVCPSKCTSELNEICGTDGVTYTNLCHLHRASCAENKKVRMAYHGPCAGGRKSCPQMCTREYRPVCGEDGVTYGNVCELRRVACRRGIQIKYTQGTCCGNGRKDPGEECDGGPCCSEKCTFRDTSYICRESSSLCDTPEYCTGDSPMCPYDKDVFFTTTKDSYIDENDPHRNFGAFHRILINNQGKSGVFGFNYTHNECIEYNKAYLYFEHRPTQNTQTLNVFGLKKNFREGNGVDYNNKGNGLGVTWECAVDRNIGNNRKDCQKNRKWKGGSKVSLGETAQVIPRGNELSVIDISDAITLGCARNWLVKSDDTILVHSKELSHIKSACVRFVK